MKKKIYRAFIAAVLLIVVLVACAPSPATQAQPVTTEVVTEEPVVTEAPVEEGSPLRIWLTWPESPQKMQAYFDEFTAETGIKTEVNTAVPYDKIIAGLSGAEPPDALILGDIFSVGMFAQEGLIMALDDIITQQEIDINDMYSSPLSQCNYAGKYYCLPWGTDDYALFWNKDMFEAAGLNPDRPPETLEEMLEYADKLTKTDSQGNLTQVGFIPDFPWMHTDLYLAMFGNTWQSPDGKEVWLDTPEMIAAMKWQQEFYTRYGADKVSRFLSSAGNYKGADSGFYTDKIAMLVDGEWQPGIDYLQQYRPDMSYGIAPMPYPEDHPERKGTVVLWGTVVEVPTNAPNKEGAAKLLQWMMLPTPQVDMMIQIPNLPSSHEAAKDPRWAENEDLQLFVDMMNSEKAVNVYVSPVTYDILTAITQIQEKVFLNGEDPAPLLQASDAEIQKKLDEALGN